MGVTRIRCQLSRCSATKAVLQLVIVAGLLASFAQTAQAYEFAARTYSLAQGFQLRGFLPNNGFALLSRQRFTQGIDLTIWDIPGWQRSRARDQRDPGGVTVWFDASLRLDHDFGTFAAGSIRLDRRRVDALDHIPELGESVVALDLLYGSLKVHGLLRDRVRLELGRMVASDGFSFAAVDGVQAEVFPLRSVALAARIGWQVKDNSPLGFANWDLDGTSSAACQEYVEGATPGTGVWREIALDKIVANRKLSSDFQLCPQRNQSVPRVDAQARWVTKQASIAVGYQRSWSQSATAFGDLGRLSYPDVGYYPNENEQAPGSGINSETMFWQSRYITKRGRRSVELAADGRYSLLHHRLDRANVSLRGNGVTHGFDLSTNYSAPTFDGDSIFSVFVIEPALDLRLGYRYDPRSASPTLNPSFRQLTGRSALLKYGGAKQQVRPLSIRTEAWLRHFLTPALAPAVTSPARNDSTAFGSAIWLDKGFAPTWSFRLHLGLGGGYGGGVGSFTSELVKQTSWRSLVALRSSVQIVERPRLDNTIVKSSQSESVSLRSILRASDLVGVGGAVEWNHNQLVGHDVRGWVTLSLGFVPEQ